MWNEQRVSRGRKRSRLGLVRGQRLADTTVDHRLGDDANHAGVLDHVARYVERARPVRGAEELARHRERHARVVDLVDRRLVTGDE